MNQIGRGNIFHSLINAQNLPEKDQWIWKLKRLDFRSLGEGRVEGGVYTTNIDALPTKLAHLFIDLSLVCVIPFLPTCHHALMATSASPPA